MLKIYHNPRCSKSRQTLDMLNENGEAPEVIEYLRNTPNRDELKELIDMLGIPAEELIRKGEKEFKEHFKGKNLTEAEWIDAMISYPKLIERPIVVKNGKAVIGRPPKTVLDIL